MKNNKYFILLFGYTRIQLFTEIKGKITSICFANGKDKLSNCVTFSYDREDLEFLPEGDPFAVDQNSSFSDYLDFAGYHFESKEAVEAIVASIIANKLIPGLGKNDDIFLYLQAFHYELKDFLEQKDNHVDICIFDKKSIEGHNIFAYDADLIYRMMVKRIRSVAGNNILLGYPFLTMFINNDEEGFSTVFAPTLERTIVEKVSKKYPLPTHIPEKLLRNIRNKILTAKLLGLPLPNDAIYQNRKVDIAKTNLSKHFDEILEEDAKYFLEKTDDTTNEPTFVFDYGMHPVIKDSFLSHISNPIFMEKEDNPVFTAFMLRNMVIEHTINDDPVFKKDAVRINKSGHDIVSIKLGNTMYFDISFIEQYLSHYGKKNILSNVETRELKSLFHDKLQSLEDNESSK